MRGGREVCYRCLRKLGIQHKSNIFERRVRDGISIWEYVDLTVLRGKSPRTRAKGETDLCGFEIDEYVVVVMDGMGVGIRAAATALEILSAYKAAVYINIRGRDRAYFLKIKVEQSPVNLRIIMRGYQELKWSADIRCQGINPMPCAHVRMLNRLMSTDHLQHLAQGRGVYFRRACCLARGQEPWNLTRRSHLLFLLFCLGAGRLYKRISFETAQTYF